MVAQFTTDAVGWTIAQLDTALTARVVSETPANLETVVPVVRVVQAGGGDDGYAIDEPTLVFHCFAADHFGSRELAYSVAAALRSLRGVPLDGAVLTRVRKITGPIWADYGNIAVRRSVLTVQLLIKST